MPIQTVQEGDCISSLASAQGFRWKTVWNDPGNALLQALRDNPNQLSPGDSVSVPELAPASDGAASTGQSHRYTFSVDVTKLRIRVLESKTNLRRDRAAIAPAPFVLSVGSTTVEGTTDETGLVECEIPATETTGLLVIDPGTAKELRVQLKLGALGPALDVRGVQARLNNMGFNCGEVDGIIGPNTLGALASFAVSVYLDPDNTEQSIVFEALRKAHDLP